MYLDKENFETGENDDLFIEPSDKNLRDVILNILIAGRDTTANALSWAFYRLCIHPEIQLKIRQEVSEVLNSKDSNRSGFLNYEKVSALKYTEAFVMEVLRLHPSVPKEAKTVLKDDVLPDGTVVKRGDVVCFLPWAMGRDPKLWDDPLEFKPERFLDKPKPSPFIYTAFQVCINILFIYIFYYS